MDAFKKRACKTIMCDFNDNEIHKLLLEIDQPDLFEECKAFRLELMKKICDGQARNRVSIAFAIVYTILMKHEIAISMKDYSLFFLKFSNQSSEKNLSVIKKNS